MLSGARARRLVLYPQFTRALRRTWPSGVPLVSVSIATVADARASATLTSRNSLAYAYRSAGRRGESALFERTLADSERVLGPSHPQTLTIRNNLSMAKSHAAKDE